MKRSPRCPICRSRSRFWSAVPDCRSGSRDFDLYKCGRCGHGFFFPGVRDQAELHTYYDDQYAQDYYPTTQNQSFLKRQIQYQRDASYLLEFLPATGVRVLDYGCSTGQFLKAMPARWTKAGFEVNPFEIAYIKKTRQPIKVISDVRRLGKHRFDLITLRGVIEHLFDIDALCSRIKSALTKTGSIYLCATPDFSSPCAVVYKSKWNQISAPLHYHQFTAASLAILFARHGFGLKALRYDYLETPYANFYEASKRFIRNVRSSLTNNRPQETGHAYPGTMVNILFERIS